MVIIQTEEKEMALLNKILGKDEREENLKKEIKSLEFRKESVLASINGEIASMRSEQRNICLEAGEYAYEAWCKDKTQSDLTSYWEKVQELADKIAAQEAKKQEMTDRYDEEIKLIASSFNMPVISSEPAVASGSASCPNCGMAIVDGDLFCQGCGTKLQ